MAIKHKMSVEGLMNGLDPISYGKMCLLLPIKQSYQACSESSHTPCKELIHLP